MSTYSHKFRIFNFRIQKLSCEICENLHHAKISRYTVRIRYSIHNSLLDFLHNLSPSHNHIIIGDFNMPDIDWSTLSAISTYSNSFCDAVYDNNLYQLITVPTHIKGNTLDLLLTDTPDNVTDIHLSAPSPPVFDHPVVYHCWPLIPSKISPLF